MQVKRLLCTAALITACSSAAIGQPGTEPAKWVGTWLLNMAESKFGPFLMPGVPADFAILSQTLKLDKTARSVRLSGETTFHDSSGEHSSHDDTGLSLAGAETVIGSVSLSFRPVDGSNFEIIGKLGDSNPNLTQVSHFSVSSDGTKLTETKTQTEREVVPEGSIGAVIRVATSVLVFDKQH
jgi:hypothetical protein